MKPTLIIGRSLCFVLLLSVTFDSSFSAARAQGSAFTYQGRLNNSGGPAGGIYDLRFAIYDSSDLAGNLIAGPLTNCATGVTNGLFVAVLDFGTGVFTGSNYWLEIAVRTNSAATFSTLAPRQPITPAPYALYAPNAGSAVTASVAGSASSVAAANLTGTVADSQISANIARLNIPNTNLQATATAVIVSGFIVETTNLYGGVGYTSNPLVTVTDVSGSNAVITATVSNGVVASLTVQTAGLHYSAGTTLTIAPPPSSADQTFGAINNFTGVNTFSGTLNANNVYLPVTTTNAGVVYSGGSTFIHEFGTNNFFAGVGAGNLTLSGDQNVGIGFDAFHNDTTGYYDTAIGAYALFNNTSGLWNTAIGRFALTQNKTGNNNTAIGHVALQSNTSGVWNTASGVNALGKNTTGSYNTADGLQALYNNTVGIWNTASGVNALISNTTGSFNTADGNSALNDNTSGSYNTASGFQSLWSNTTGSNNIALGTQAGYNVTNSYNIEIGNAGTATDAGTIRIGTRGIHTNTFIAGLINGDGGGLSNLNATTVGGLAATNFWRTGGNSGTSPANGNFIGTTDNQPFELRANSVAGLRLESTSGTMNVIGGFGGSGGNIAMPGAIGVTIGGGGYSGSANRAANFSTVGGGYRNDALADLATIGGGNFNTADGGTATVGGGFSNRVSGQYASALGGDRNSAVGDYSAIGGGEQNVIGAGHGTIAGGAGNSVQGNWSTVGGGLANSANGFEAVIAGGANNVAGGATTFVGGGSGNQANGGWSTVPGGKSNIAQGENSFAAGTEAQAQHNGAFVWSDGSTNTFSTASNQFMARASGGVVFYTSTNTTSGVSLAAGSGAWSSLSDRNSKDNFSAVDAREVLNKVAVLPLNTWNYKTQDKSIRHIGPVAQDFHAAFGVGEDERHITTIDSEGVALAAIQGLNEKLQDELKRRDVENEDLKQRLEKLEWLMNEQKGGVK